MNAPDTLADEILAVDDNLESLRLLSQILSEAGYRVRLASDGELALRTAKVQPPALVLLDIRMPGLDGFEVCRRLREDEKTRSVPVIFLSALDAMQDKVKAFNAGGMDYINKPIQEEEVLARTKVHLALRHAQLELEERNAEIAAARDTLEDRVKERSADLEQANSKLQQQIDIHLQTLEALRKSELNYRRIVDTANEGIWQLSVDGITTSVNARMAEMLGYSVDEMAGRPMTDFMFKEDEPDHLRKMEIRAREISEHYERRFRRKDEEAVWTIASATPILDADGRNTGAFAMFTDITERKQAEELLHRLNRELHALANCNQALMRAVDEQVLLNEICRIVCDEAGYQLAWVGYAEYDEAKTIRPVASAGEDSGYLTQAKLTWADTERGRGPSGRAIQSGKTAFIQDFATDPQAAPWREAAAERGFRSSIALPLKDESEKTFGILNIYSETADAFTRDEIRILEELASNLAFGITALRAREEHRLANEELRRRKAQLEERTTELLLARDAAEAANKAKNVFLANMSHELRTPLTAILGFSALLRSEPQATENMRESLAIISRSGEQLLMLINQVLEITRVEAGRKQLQIAPFDLGAMVHEVTDMMRLRADEVGLRLEVEQSPSVPRYIKADGPRLRQILVNLAENAVKFTRAGGVMIRLSLKQDALPHLVIEVEDTGPGISREDLKSLFKPFARLGEVGTQGGTGLGLALSRQFAELMGGTVSATSTQGKGSVFRADVPVELAVAADIDKLQPAAEAGAVAGLAPGTPRYRILIAEDQAENQLLLNQLMARIGLDVKVAGNGQECVKLFQEWHPHLIWMDRRMPVMNGIEATERIRKLPGGQDVKIVAVTASIFKEQQARMLDAGMDDLVCKPYRMHEIYGCLTKQLGVTYVYKAASVEVGGAPTTLSAEMLAALPAELCKELKQALESLDSARIASVIQRVNEADETVGQALTRMADDFDYPAILKALPSKVAAA